MLQKFSYPASPKIRFAYQASPPQTLSTWGCPWRQPWCFRLEDLTTEFSIGSQVLQFKEFRSLAKKDATTLKVPYLLLSAKLSHLLSFPQSKSQPGGFEMRRKMGFWLKMSLIDGFCLFPAKVRPSWVSVLKWRGKLGTGGQLWHETAFVAASSS